MEFYKKKYDFISFQTLRASVSRRYCAIPALLVHHVTATWRSVASRDNTMKSGIVAIHSLVGMATKLFLPSAKAIIDVILNDSFTLQIYKAHVYRSSRRFSVSVSIKVIIIRSSPQTNSTKTR